ncbi:MAG: helix-turn-helix domain-containing protein [Candidatus Gracilibacteria bacterium]|jgi:excisionase family DNA binding protein
MIEKFLTTEQVADILQVHPFTILKFLKSGRLKGLKLGRVYRIKESDVHDFLEKSSVKAKKQPQSSQENDLYNDSQEIEGKRDSDDHYYII